MTQTVTASELKSWLTDRVASYVRRPAGEIAGDRALADFGLDSVYTLTLAADIEDHLNLSLDPTVMWDHPTIDALTKVLHKMSAAR